MFNASLQCQCQICDVNFLLGRLALISEISSDDSEWILIFYVYIIVEALATMSLKHHRINDVFIVSLATEKLVQVYRSHKIPTQKSQMSSAFCKPGALADFHQQRLIDYDGPVKGKLNIWLQIPQSSWLLAPSNKVLVVASKTGSLYTYTVYTVYTAHVYILILHTWNPCVPYFRFAPSKKKGLFEVKQGSLIAILWLAYLIQSWNSQGLTGFFRTPICWRWLS